jgi:CRP/FNR family cyclic AMP-dependent transcriptional regulator
MAQDYDLIELLKTRGPHTIVSLRPGQSLFIENDEADAMYIVKSGMLRVGRGDTIYEILRPGSIVGEMAIIDEHRRSASVIASTHAELFKIDQTEFLSLIATSPHFALTVMRVMSQRLRIMNERNRPKPPTASSRAAPRQPAEGDG